MMWMESVPAKYGERFLGKFVKSINKGITPLAITVFSIFIYAVPTVIAIVGISVGIKRKFL